MRFRFGQRMRFRFRQRMRFRFRFRFRMGTHGPGHAAINSLVIATCCGLAVAIFADPPEDTVYQHTSAYFSKFRVTLNPRP